jgi:hypothetical protein
MQFNLSTLFLIFFNVAASLALFGAVGIYAVLVLSLAALCLNCAKKLLDGIVLAILIIFIGVITPALLSSMGSAREAVRRAQCLSHLKQIGFALLTYHDANKNFPPANVCDKNGKPLFSWRVEILPMMQYGKIYDTAEPWNSSHNSKLSSEYILEYQCPWHNSYENDSTTNYVAIIGPGTAWREDGPVKRSDLPDNGSHTVMVVEVVNSGLQWAEPRDLTVDEALEGLKTGKGLRISSAHPYCINVLFADGSVRTLPAKMPISVWKKLLAGEIKDFDDIEEMIDPSAPDKVDVYVLPPQPGKWLIILSIIVWLLSVALLFRRAIKSRRNYRHPERSEGSPLPYQP